MTDGLFPAKLVPTAPGRTARVERKREEAPDATTFWANGPVSSKWVVGPKGFELIGARPPVLQRTNLLAVARHHPGARVVYRNGSPYGIAVPKDLSAGWTIVPFAWEKDLWEASDLRTARSGSDDDKGALFTLGDRP